MVRDLALLRFEEVVWRLLRSLGDSHARVVMPNKVWMAAPVRTNCCKLAQSVYRAVTASSGTQCSVVRFSVKIKSGHLLRSAVLWLHQSKPILADECLMNRFCRLLETLRQYQGVKSISTAKACVASLYNSSTYSLESCFEWDIQPQIPDTPGEHVVHYSVRRSGIP